MVTSFRSLTSMMLVILCSQVADAADNPPGGMQLLAGYQHQPLQGIDSIVGKIVKPNGLEIFYEIGRVPKPNAQFRLGGDFSDRPKKLSETQRKWYREQMVGGEPVHLAYTKKNVLMVSYPKRGINFHVPVKNADEMAEALLMMLTVPNERPKPVN